MDFHNKILYGSIERTNADNIGIQNEKGKKQKVASIDREIDTDRSNFMRIST